MPKISFVCPSYNHEKYIDNFVESVLNQIEENFELIIVDDNSQDSSMQKVSQFNDPRITIIKHLYNQGMMQGLNDGIAAAKSDIIVFIASDDVLAPDYAEKILKAFENPEIGVVYVGLQYMDEDGNHLPTPDNLLPLDSTRYEILYKSFLFDNQVPSPGMAFRKSAIAPFLPFKNGLLLFADSEMHMLLMLFNEISFINEPLVYYRMAPNSASRARGYVIRRNVEINMLLDSFTEHIGLNKFNEIFGSDEIVQKYKATKETLPYLLGMIALNSKNYDRKIWGYQKIASFISTMGNMDLLHSLYGFTFKDYMNLVNKFQESRENKLNKKLNKKLKKYRKRFQYSSFFVVMLLILCILLVIL